MKIVCGRGEDIHSLFDECFATSAYEVHIIDKDDQNHIYIINYNDEEQKNDDVIEWISRLQQIQGFVYMIGVGNPVENLRNLCRSYSEACNVILFVEESKDDGIIFYKDIARVEKQRAFLSEEKGEMLVQYIIEGQRDKVIGVIDEIYESNFKERFLSDFAKLNLITRMVVLIQKVIYDIYPEGSRKQEEFERISRKLIGNNDYKESFKMLKEVCEILSNENKISSPIRPPMHLINSLHLCYTRISTKNGDYLWKISL